MIIGFTGTQSGLAPAQLWAMQEQLARYLPDELHHGDCLGADAEAHDAVIAGHAGCCRIIVHPPLLDRKRAFKSTLDLRVTSVYPRHYLDRNKDIVDASERLLACPPGPEALRSGTWSAVRYARKQGKPITIVWPDGHVTEEP